MRPLPARAFAFVLLAVIAAPLAHAARTVAPAWLAALAAQPAAMDYGDAHHVVLLDEATLAVDKTGVITRRVRYAIRLLTLEGRNAAFARLPYETSSDKVKSFQAWLIPKTGEPSVYGKKDTVDAAVFSSSRELYGESRHLLISAEGEAVAGGVFGFEGVLTNNSVHSQEIWSFQQTVPVERSAFTLTLPPGWIARAHIFNHAPIAPQVTAATQTWELRNLPASVDEPLSPSRYAQSPWLAIDLIPPAGTKSISRQAFTTWPEVSDYFSARYDAAALPDAAIKARASTAVAGATGQWDRIARLCRAAQSVNYLSIDLNLGKAGGFLPRTAARVLQCNYGDCKDKATLLRALLRSEGIESFPVILYSGDPTHVREEWVSPLQFNHCILAIRVDDSVDVPALLIHPRLGRLVIFDPTSESTPPGWLAEEDLDGLALFLAGQNGDLARLPRRRPADNRVERTIRARLAGDGSVSGTIEERFEGIPAADIRDERKGTSESDYKNNIIQRWLARTLPTARALRVEPKDEFDQGRFSLAIDFESPSYGKLMRNTLLVFKPVMVARRDNSALKKKKRTQPVVIPPTFFAERAEIELPATHNVDELFQPVELSAPFGTYSAKAEIRDNRLFFERTLELRAATLPADDYEVARVFFEKILQAEQSPVVLKRN